MESVLFKPIDDAMLQAGVGGGRPPMAWHNDRRYHRRRSEDGFWFPFDGTSHAPTWGDALMLAWEDTPTVDGLDRLYRACLLAGGVDRVAPADWHACEMTDVVWLAEAAQALGLGEVIIVGVQHGFNCEKAEHDDQGGYLHGHADDEPYWVDDIRHCGRCHVVLS